MKLVSQTLPEASMARPRGLLMLGARYPVAGEIATPELVKAERELPSRFAIQTRLLPSMAICAGPLRPPPVYPLAGETRAPFLSETPMALFLALAYQTLSAESMATKVRSLAAAVVSSDVVERVAGRLRW